MTELTSRDLNFVLQRCPRDIVKLLKEHPGKLFLAGGFIRATIAGEKVSDIDLFGGHPTDLDHISKDLALKRKGSRLHTSKNAITLLAPPRFPVQFITRWTFTDPAYLMLSFDFTICQAVVYAREKVVNVGEENESKIIVFDSCISDNFYSDLAARRLVYTFPVREEEAGGSFMRVVKFIKKGYNIQAPSLAGVVSRLVAKLDEKKVEISSELRNESEEKWRARVITALLREVDPLTVVDGVDWVDEHEVMTEEDA